MYQNTGCKSIVHLASRRFLVVDFLKYVYDGKRRLDDTTGQGTKPVIYHVC
jgi:hypothetical protein